MVRAVVVVLGVVACVHGVPQSRPAPTPREILDAAAKVYASASSYADRGRHTTVLRVGSQKQERVITFATAFVRAGDFRFEFFDAGDPAKAYATWRDGSGVRSRWYVTHDKEAQVPSLGEALAAATGVSGGTAHMIPRLLMPDVEGWSLMELGALALDPAPALVDARSCWKISGLDGDGDRMTVWIDRETHLVRRIASSHHFAADDRRPAFDADDTTTYEPTLMPSHELLARRPEALAQPPLPPWLGVTFDDSARAPHVTGVVPQGPAARAGLLVGDDVVAIDGKAISTAGEVIRLVARATVGKRVAVTVSRAGQTLVVPVTLEARPNMRQLAHDYLIDKPAPPFDLPVAANTGSAKLANLVGQVVLLDFWATWCVPCEYAVPQLEALHQKYGSRGLHVLGISNDSAADIAQYATAHAMTYTLARDEGDTIARSYWESAIPMLVLIDRAGVVRAVNPDRDNLEAAIVELLK